MATAAAAAEPVAETVPATAASTGEEEYTGPKTVKVQTTDDQTVEVDMSHMVLCQTLKSMCQSLWHHHPNASLFFVVSFFSFTFFGEMHWKTVMEGECEEALPLNVSSRALRMVEKFCKYHKENPKEASRFIAGGKVDSFKKFDKEFTDELKADVTLLFETLSAADYLDERPLLDVLCHAIAVLIKGKTEEQIRAMFSLCFFPSHLSPVFLYAVSFLLLFLVAFHRHPQGDRREAQGDHGEAPSAQEVPVKLCFTGTLFLPHPPHLKQHMR